MGLVSRDWITASVAICLKTMIVSFNFLPKKREQFQNLTFHSPKKKEQFQNLTFHLFIKP